MWLRCSRAENKRFQGNQLPHRHCMLVDCVFTGNQGHVYTPPAVQYLEYQTQSFKNKAMLDLETMFLSCSWPARLYSSTCNSQSRDLVSAGFCHFSQGPRLNKKMHAWKVQAWKQGQTKPLSTLQILTRLGNIIHHNSTVILLDMSGFGCKGRCKIHQKHNDLSLVTGEPRQESLAILPELYNSRPQSPTPWRIVDPCWSPISIISDLCQNHMVAKMLVQLVFDLAPHIKASAKAKILGSGLQGFFFVCLHPRAAELFPQQLVNIWLKW